MAFLNWHHLSLLFCTLLNLSTTSKDDSKFPLHSRRILEPTPLSTPDSFGGIKYGRYSIVNCSPPNATHLSHILESLKSTVRYAVDDTLRIHPSAAYATFFNDVYYASFVRDILTLTTTGLALDEQGSPIFWCVQGLGELRYQDRHSGQTGDMYTRCQQHPGSVLQGMHGTPYIAVCPQFYTLPITDSPPEEKCLAVEHNRFKGNGWEIAFFRMWLVLNELVQYYIYAITGSETVVEDVNRATWLEGKASTRNAKNYIYYVASKSSNIPILPSRRGTGTQD